MLLKILILANIRLAYSQDNAVTSSNSKDSIKDSNYNHHGPLVRCDMLPLEFLDCQELIDHKGKEDDFNKTGLGCLNFGGTLWQDVKRGKRMCSALSGIECFTSNGNNTFTRDGFACVKFGDHYFLTTLLYSILLGFLGMDRFSLGQTGVAVMKLLSLGGLGLWWIVDIFLLVTNNLTPENNWNQYV